MLDSELAAEAQQGKLFRSRSRSEAYTKCAALDSNSAMLPLAAAERFDLGRAALP